MRIDAEILTAAHPLAMPLAQQRGGSQASFWLWLFVLIVVTMLAGVVILLVRRRLFEDQKPDTGSGTLMEQLRGMRDRGEISEAEYDQTRKSIAARAAGRESPGGAAGSDWAGQSGRKARPGLDLTGEPLPGANPRGSGPDADED